MLPTALPAVTRLLHGTWGETRAVGAHTSWVTAKRQQMTLMGLRRMGLVTIMGMQAGVQDQSPGQPFPASFAHSCLLRHRFYLLPAEKRVLGWSLGHHLKEQMPLRGN